MLKSKVRTNHVPDNKLTHFPVWQGQEGEGRCQISLILTDTGNGLNGLLTGGGKPHIGGVVLAVPRPSLSGKGWSADVYITPVPGHKDVDVARTVADTLARELRCPVVVTAGIHTDQLRPEELREIIYHCEALTQAALASLNSTN